MLRDNVRISETGRRLLDNKELANRVADAIMKGKDKLREGIEVKVEGGNILVQLVSSLDDETLCTEKAG